MNTLDKRERDLLRKEDRAEQKILSKLDNQFNFESLQMIRVNSFHSIYSHSFNSLKCK